jgi:hypothetical protein
MRNGAVIGVTWAQRQAHLQWKHLKCSLHTALARIYTRKGQMLRLGRALVFLTDILILEANATTVSALVPAGKRLNKTHQYLRAFTLLPVLASLEF